MAKSKIMVRVIFDSGNNTHTQLFWDANGNLSQILNCKEEYARFHDWDDENRLRMVLDNTKAGFYGYDANGERVYKLTGTSSLLHKSDEDSEAYVMWDSVVLYPNPYMTITPNEYTKHFYMNGERLASSIGGGGWCSVSPDAISSSLTSHETDLLNEWPKIYNNEYPFEYPHETMPSLTTNEDIFGQTSPDLQYVCPMRHLYTLNMNYKQDILWSVMHDFCLSSDDKTIYYRHSDHLGSANWITDQDGHAVQYLHYLPYGELLLNQQVAGYDERYKFTDKERDAESGYDYFGARYYASPLYNWTSVDPLSDKFPQISPYAYCNWNPIKFIDPNGKAIHVAAGAIIGAAIGGTISGISAMNDPTKSGRQVLGAIAGGAVSGAITGGAAAATGGLSFIGTGGTIAISAVAGFIGETSGSAVNQGIGNGEIDGGEVLRAGFVGAAAGTITGAASKGVSEVVKKSGVVQSIQTKMLNGVKSGTGKAAKQQANQTRKSIINFCSPGNDKQFQMKDLITYPADVVGQEVSTGVTTSGAVVDKTQEIQSNVVDKLGL